MCQFKNFCFCKEFQVKVLSGFWYFLFWKIKSYSRISKCCLVSKLSLYWPSLVTYFIKCRIKKFYLVPRVHPIYYSIWNSHLDTIKFTVMGITKTFVDSIFNHLKTRTYSFETLGGLAKMIGSWDPGSLGMIWI